MKFDSLARWMLAHQSLDQRRTLIAYYDKRSEGDALRAAISARHKKWKKLRTIEARKREYSRGITEGLTE